jgi:osmoprotectant transport system substrate-binding protein
LGGGRAGEVDLSDADFVVGSKDFTEQLILGYITLQALEATGASVEDQVGLAGTDAARQALIGGDIDMYWEYTGTIWINHLGNTKPIPDPERQYDEAAKADMEENPEEATVCVESEFNSRGDGLPGMEEEYGFQFPKGNISLFDTGVVYQRTDKGDPCNFGEVFVTDGRISALGLTVIEDDKNFFPIYNPALEVRKETYDEYGEQLDEVFGPIAKALHTKTMTQMNARVDVDGELPEDVAEDFHSENGFVE